jgi:hypothetical protein
MAALASICFLVGAVFGLRFKVLILVRPSDSQCWWSPLTVLFSGRACGGLRWSGSSPQQRFSWATSVGQSRSCSSRRLLAARSGRGRASAGQFRTRPAES